jgi:hypothetical protein
VVVKVGVLIIYSSCGVTSRFLRRYWELVIVISRRAVSISVIRVYENLVYKALPIWSARWDGWC